MPTWHITVHNRVFNQSPYQNAAHSLVLCTVSIQFIDCGFTVQPMPEVDPNSPRTHRSPALTVSHSSASAITLYLLRYHAEQLDIQRVV
jgi:hypothetical protein